MPAGYLPFAVGEIGGGKLVALDTEAGGFMDLDHPVLGANVMFASSALWSTQVITVSECDPAGPQVRSMDSSIPVPMARQEPSKKCSTVIIVGCVSEVHGRRGGVAERPTT